MSRLSLSRYTFLQLRLPVAKIIWTQEQCSTSLRGLCRTIDRSAKVPNTHVWNELELEVIEQDFHIEQVESLICKHNSTFVVKLQGSSMCPPCLSQCDERNHPLAKRFEDVESYAQYPLSILWSLIRNAYPFSSTDRPIPRMWWSLSKCFAQYLNELPTLPPVSFKNCLSKLKKVYNGGKTNLTNKRASSQSLSMNCYWHCLCNPMEHLTLNI